MTYTPRPSLISIRLSNHLVLKIDSGHLALAVASFIYSFERRNRERLKKNKERTRQDILSSSFFLLFFELNFISVSFYDFSIFQTIWYKDELMYLYLATMPLSIGLVFFSLNDNNWLHISNLSVTRDLLELYVCFHTSSGTCDVLNWPESELVICITHPEEAPPQPTPSCFDNNDTERE